VRHAIRIASSNDAHRLHDARATKLLGDDLVLPHTRGLDKVGLDATHEVCHTRLHDRKELRKLLLELCDDALKLRALLAVEHELGFVRRIGEELANGRLVRTFENDHQILAHRILVLLKDARRGISNLPSEVRNLEGIFFLERLLESLVGAALSKQLFGKGAVGTFRNDALFVQDGQDASWLALDELDHLLIIDLGHVCDLDIDVLLSIFLHGGVEDGLIERGLKLLVREVNAQLLKGILIEDFEAKNIQDANEEARPSEAVVELHVREVGIDTHNHP